MSNYFDFYELPVKFNLNEQELKEKYFQLLKLNHPDFHVNDAEKYQASLVNSSFNNEAYKCLSNFYRRANYILSISALPLDEKLPSDFLMEMMDLNEALAEAEIEDDMPRMKQLFEEVSQFEADNDKEFLNAAFALNSGNTALSMQLLKDSYLKMKYILRLKERLINFAPR